jgi:capsular exopolysaccharide synthesis family protein
MISLKDIGENPKLVLILLRKYWLLVLITVILGVGVAYTYNKCATPLYTSNISLLIWNREIDKIKAAQENLSTIPNREVSDVMTYNSLISSSLHVSQNLIPAFRKLINSKMIAKLTAEKLYKQNFSKPLNYSFKSNVKMNSCVIDLDVTSPDPELAVAAANALYECFAKEQERLMNVKYIQAITPASVPESPSYPRKKVNIIIGLLIGVLLGFGISACVEMLDVTIKTSEDIKSFELLPLGMIPEVAEIDTFNHTKKFEQGGNLHSVVDAVRVINTTIDFLKVNNPLQVIATTSALLGSGKTTFSVLLGKAMGAAQKKVLIIDCDLRKPKLYKNLALTDKIGLVKYLIEPESDYKKYIQKNIFPGVDIMPNSLIPPNPTELLSTPKFRDMIEDLKKDYDCILLDCPPGLNMADAMVIGKSVEGIILMVESAKTKIKEFEHLLEQFGTLRSKIIGAVLNKVSVNNSKYSYYSYRYYGKSPQNINQELENLENKPAS